MMGHADAHAGGARRRLPWVALAVGGLVCVVLGLVAPVTATLVPGCVVDVGRHGP